MVRLLFHNLFVGTDVKEITYAFRQEMRELEYGIRKELVKHSLCTTLSES